MVRTAFPAIFNGGKKTVDRFDPTGPSAHIRQFQPFQDDSDWRCFRGALKDSGLHEDEDEDAKSAVWDAMGDELDDQIDSFLKEHYKGFETKLMRDEW